jgi:hypothetical protein
MTEYLKALEELQRCISDGTWPGSDSLRLLTDEGVPRGVQVWRSEVDPADLKVSTDLPGVSKEGEILAGDSFARFIGLEPDLSILVRRAAKVNCLRCGKEMLHSDRASVLSNLKESAGFLVLGINISDPELKKLPISIVLDLLGAHSVVVKGVRLIGEPLSAISRELLGEVSEVSFILRTYSLPLTEADKEEIISGDFSASGDFGDFQFSILGSLKEFISFSPFDAEYYCPTCAEYELPILDQKRLLLGRHSFLKLNDIPLSEVRDAVAQVEQKSQCGQKLDLLMSAGFSDYPLGYPLHAFSSSELLRLLVARFMLLAGGDLRLDLTAVSGILSPIEIQKLKAAFKELEIPAKISNVSRRNEDTPKVGHNFKIGPYRVSPFSFSEIQLSKGSLNVLEGDGDTLLSSISTDPKLKREFGRIRYLEEGDYSITSYIIEALGLPKLVAKLLAGSYEARMAGVSEKDLNFTLSRKLCSQCVRLGSSINPECDECGGNILKVGGAEIRFNGLSLGDILRIELVELEQKLSGVRDFNPYFDWLRRFNLSEISLGHKLSALPLDRRESLPLVRFFAEMPVDPSLILMKNPARALSERQNAALISALRELIIQGHTLVISDSSGRFYQIAETVIRLRSEFKDSQNRLVKEDR